MSPLLGAELWVLFLPSERNPHEMKRFTFFTRSAHGAVTAARPGWILPIGPPQVCSCKFNIRTLDECRCSAQSRGGIDGSASEQDIRQSTMPSAGKAFEPA